MGKDINIPMSLLSELNVSLKSIIIEFDDAKHLSNALEGAIGSPAGRDGLRDEVDRFEGAWNDKRETLKGHLEEIQKHVEETGTAWADFDLEAAKSFDLDNRQPAPPVEGNA